MADVTYDASASILKDIHALRRLPAELTKKINTLSAQVTAVWSVDGRLAPELSVRLDMRYQGQSYELGVDVLLPLTSKGLDEAVSAFHSLHKDRS